MPEDILNELYQRFTKIEVKNKSVLLSKMCKINITESNKYWQNKTFFSLKKIFFFSHWHFVINLVQENYHPYVNKNNYQKTNIRLIKCNEKKLLLNENNMIKYLTIAVTKWHKKCIKKTLSVKTIK